MKNFVCEMKRGKIKLSDYEKLKGIINDAEKLIEKEVTSREPEFSAWHVSASRFLKSHFGDESYEFNDFQGCCFMPTVYVGEVSKEKDVVACQKGLKEAIAIFRTYLSEMEEDTQEVNQNNFDNKKVFVVHGHDELRRDEVELFIGRIGLKPIILSNQPSEGATIIEKIESNTNVGFALVLYTACDLGKANEDNSELKFRARQNVVFEHGYLIAKLGRQRVLALVADENIETPSDLSGVVYVQMNDDWKTKVKRELKSCGLEFDELGD